MKKKPSTYTRAGRSNVTLKNFLNNLKENDLHFENNQITQCVFLGVLRLKPVPSMFCTSAAVSADSFLEVKNRNKRNRRVGNNNTSKELNKNSGHKGEINKVISGRISKKDTIRVKQSVKKVPVTQSILKVNLKMNKKQETPSTASCLSNSIILSDTKIIPQCASFPRSPIEDQSIPNPVQNLFNKLKQQIDERNHQQEGSTDLLPTRKLKYKSNKRKSLQDRLPMPLQSGSSSIEIDSDSSGFKDDGITCSSSDTNSISPVSQNSVDDKVSNKEVILIEDEDAQRSNDVVILDGPSKSLLSVVTSQNRDVIVMDQPKVLRVSPRIKRVDETKPHEVSTNMRELRVAVPTNDDNNSNDPSSSLLQTFMQTSDSDKPKKRRRLMPMAMPSIFFNTPMLLRSELAQKRGAPVDNRPAARATPRLAKSETKQEKPVLKQRKDQHLDKTEENQHPSKNNDNLIYEVVKSSETTSSSDKEIIVIDDVPLKVEPLILKLRVSPQKANTSKTTAHSASGSKEAVMTQKLLPPEKKYKLQLEECFGPASIINSAEEKQVSVEQKNKVIENTPDLSKLDENKVQCIIIEDDDKSSEKEKTSSDEIIFVVPEDNAKSINPEPPTQPKITVVKESVLKSPQSNDLVIQKTPEQHNHLAIIGQNTPIDPQEKTELIEESVLSNIEGKESVEEQEVILIDSTQSAPVLMENKKSPKHQQNNGEAFSNQLSSELQNSVTDIVKPDTEPLEETSQIQSTDEDAERKRKTSEDLVDVSKNEDISSTEPNISENINTNNDMKDSPTPKTFMNETAMPLLATSRVLRSEKPQQKSTEQTVIDAKVTAMKMEEPQKKNESKSTEPENKETPRLLRSEKSQSKPADQKNKSITGELAEQEALLEPEKTPQEMKREQYVNPPEATSRVLRSEKSQPKSLDQKNKNNKEPDGTYVVFPGATARVLRSEKIQQKVSYDQQSVSNETKSKVEKTYEKISVAEDVKTIGKNVSPKIKTEEKLGKKSNKGGKRSLRSSVTPAKTDSPSSHVIHEKSKRGVKNRSRKKNSQESRKAVKKIEKAELHIEKIKTKVRRNATDKDENAAPKQKMMAVKKQERNKKIIRRVLRSSDIKHPQPEVMVKTKPARKPGNRKATVAKKRNESVLSKSNITKLNKLRKIVSIKTKKIAKEKKIVNWKNNQIIEEIIQELKNTIFKNEPEVAKKNAKLVKIIGNQKSRPKRSNATNRTQTQLQKRKFVTKKKKKQATKATRNQSVAKVDEETREAAKIPTRRTGSRRNVKSEIPVNEAPKQKSKRPRAGNRKSSRNLNAKEEMIEEKEPKVAEAIRNEEQQLENAAVEDELMTPVEIDGTPLIIEVDGSLNEKKKEANAVVMVGECQEKPTEETELKRKTPPAASSSENKKTKVPKRDIIVEPVEEAPADEREASSRPGAVTSSKHAAKKTSIIIHDDIVLPEETVRRSDLVDRKGNIDVFDFEENELESAAPLRPTKLWSRINVDQPRRKKKLWSVVEQPASRRRAPVEESRDGVFVGRADAPPGVKREAGGRAPEAAVGSVGLPADSTQPGGNADAAASPVKSESPMKQLTITEMFSKFSKRKSPPHSSLDADDCQPKRSLQREPPEAAPKGPPPPPAGDPAHPGPSEARREDAQPSRMLPPTKTETRRYSRIDNAEDDDSDCESRAEWVPEEYAEYKFKYSAQKMMQVKPIYKCKVCLALLPSYYKLVKHKKCHENVDNPYNCTQCGALFNNVEDFSAHLRAHKGKHPYECLKCSMGFWTKQAYEDHAPVHVLRKQKPSVKRFRCDICAKEFSKLCDVERHTRVHTGEKPCVCNICNKGFQQSHNLSKHLLTHLHIKPFQCEICNRQFGRNDVLNRHLLTHSIEKPVKCWVCSKGFIRHTQLVVHLMNHHPDQPLEDPNQAERPAKGEEEEEEDEEERKTDEEEMALDHGRVK